MQKGEIRDTTGFSRPFLVAPRAYGTWPSPHLLHKWRPNDPGAMTRAQWKQGHKNGNKGFCCAETRKFVQQLFSRPCNISRYEILAGDQRFLEPSVSLCQSVSSVSQSSLSVPVFVCACCACCALPPAHWRTNARRKRLCVGLALSGLPDDELSKRFLRRSRWAVSLLFRL